MNTAEILSTVCAAALLASCANRTVRKQDLDSWINVPVEALDTHSFFLTLPMVRTKTDSGIEIRNYANGQNFSGCSGGNSTFQSGKWIQGNSFANCTNQWLGCNNIFYIKESKVIEYAPTGQCYTDEITQPQERYRRLKAAGGA